MCETSRDFDGDDVRESKVKVVRRSAPDSEWVTVPPNASGE
ncbi:hypothetical protein [Haladaptatus salinisoli]|nr:hypothetical protein [Haladaptatus salinisoli]